MNSILRTLLMIGVLGFITSYTTISSAADGCGRGFHRNMHGYCVSNYRPYGRHFHHRSCWRNMWGELRCYRRW